MKLVHFFTCIILLSLLSCKSSKTKFSDSQIEAIETLIENRNFTIESDWAYPLVTNAMQQVLNSGLLQAGNSASAINLIGNTNFLTIAGDSISSYLPYFGERQMNVDYGGTDGAIQLKGIMESYSLTKGKNNSFNIKFNAQSKSERFQVYIKVFSNYKTDIQVLGNSRFSISYAGLIEASKKK